MSRLRADLLLLLVAIIWGTTFIAQKTTTGLGPFSFVGVRFALSFIIVLPFAMREVRGKPFLTPNLLQPAFLLCGVFSAGVITQQIGTQLTSVTNAGFLTGLYVIVAPIVERFLFRKMPRSIIWLACLMSFCGVWFLNGATLTNIGRGDVYIIACAVCFGIQVPLIGRIIAKYGSPICWAIMEYMACTIIGLTVGIWHEHLTWQIISANIWPLLYAGGVSGGIAYTLQGVAQQYTDASKAAIIMSSEALFAAIAGALILGEQLELLGWLGCAIIFTAMCLTELPSLRLFKNA